MNRLRGRDATVTSRLSGMDRKARTALTAFAVATLGIAVFSAMDAVMKGLSLAIGAYNALLWRSFAGVAITGVLFLRDAHGLARPHRRCASI